jgi:hypothetical protein
LVHYTGAEGMPAEGVLQPAKDVLAVATADRPELTA